MPNWCDNQLFIKGEKAELDNFIQQIKNSPEQTQKRGQELDILQNLYPCPQELIETVSGFLSGDEQIALEQKQSENLAKYGHKDWYDWCNSNWGTKWGDSDTFLEFFVDDKIALNFQSAWSPPINGIAHIATMFPALEFTLSYNEGGMGFYGVTTFTSEHGILDECYEYEDLEGWDNISDGETEETMFDAWEKRNELVDIAREQLLEEAGI